MSGTQASLPWYCGLASRLHILPGEPYPYVVVAALTDEDATPEALVRPSAMSALLTHSTGKTWPDQRGESLARASLEAGGVVALAFTNLAGALACERKIRGG